MFQIDKKILNIIVIILLTFITFWWTFFIFHKPFNIYVVLIVIMVRLLFSLLLFKDYSLSWSKVSQKTFLTKSFLYVLAFLAYMPIFYTHIYIYFMASELFLYLFGINFIMYLYYYLVNRSKIHKTKSVVIYGSTKAGIKLVDEFYDSEYRIRYFVDDEAISSSRSIDSIEVLSTEKLVKKLDNFVLDLLVVVMPSDKKDKIKSIYESLSPYFEEIKILYTSDGFLDSNKFSAQLKNISAEDLLARHPKDLDKNKIHSFIKDKTILVTGAGGSIGSEICRQCESYGAKKLILLDHSEYNLYTIGQEIQNIQTVQVMQSVVNEKFLDETFETHKPDIVIHAAAYKHVPLVEANIHEGILNNVIGTKNIIDISIKHNVEKFVLISTDKAVRPTNVMGTTKRICELYAQNSNGMGTDIVAVRFGNVLGSSGSVIPKFKSQILNGQNLTVTHPEITRYLMLIPEACELVLQAASIGEGGEVFILDMGEPIKIVDLAKKMIELSAKDGIGIDFIGLRPGEKLHEELLINETDTRTEYESITVAKSTKYDINKLRSDIDELLNAENQLSKLKEIVPEFTHMLHN